MEKMFWVYLIALVCLLTGFLHYRRKCAGMIREYRAMKTNAAQHQTIVSSFYQRLIPDTLLSQSRIIQDIRAYFQMMISDIEYAARRPEMIDLVASNYATAKIVVATLMETSYMHGASEQYLHDVRYRAGGEQIDDDTDIITLYRLLNRPLPVNLYFFNTRTRKKEKR